jgi:hypothetical protein
MKPTRDSAHVSSSNSVAQRIWRNRGLAKMPRIVTLCWQGRLPPACGRTTPRSSRNEIWHRFITQKTRATGLGNSSRLILLATTRTWRAASAATLSDPCSLLCAGCCAWEASRVTRLAGLPNSRGRRRKVISSPPSRASCFRLPTSARKRGRTLGNFCSRYNETSPITHFLPANWRALTKAPAPNCVPLRHGVLRLGQHQHFGTADARDGARPVSPDQPPLSAWKTKRVHQKFTPL